MKAFLGQQEVKDKYYNRVKAHFAADEIVKGKYWENGKGCAVGCTIHSSNHAVYETELGIPSWLARLEDRIFEGMPLDKAKLWPKKFLKSINVGANLEKIKIPMLIFIVELAREKFDNKKFPNRLKYIDNILKELKKDVIDLDKLRKARAAAAYATAYAAAAYAAAAAAYATAYARENEYVKFANKLLRLLKECK